MYKKFNLGCALGALFLMGVFTSSAEAQTYRMDWGAIGWVDGCVVVGTACEQTFTNIGGSTVDMKVAYPRAGKTNANNPLSPNVDTFDPINHYIGDEDVLRLWKENDGGFQDDKFVISFSEPISILKIGQGGARPRNNANGPWARGDMEFFAGPNATGALINTPSAATALPDVSVPDALFPGQPNLLTGTHPTWTKDAVMGDANAAVLGGGTYSYIGTEKVVRPWVIYDLTGAALMATPLESFTWDINIYDGDDPNTANQEANSFAPSHYLTGFEFTIENLPVELGSFDALGSGDNNVSLSWNTLSEQNNLGFAIEHLYENGSYNEIGFVEGNGDSSIEQSYSFMVNDVQPGLSKFRLKQIDFDGSSSYSEVIEHTQEVVGKYFLSDSYPNPFNPEARISFSLASEGQATVTLHNMQGQALKTLFEGQVEANKVNQVQIDGSELASGMYLIRLTGADFSSSKTVTLLK